MNAATNPMHFTPEERAHIERVTPLRLECGDDGNLLAVSRDGFEKIRGPQMYLAIHIHLKLATRKAELAA
jgi:hypothetical protein